MLGPPNGQKALLVLRPEDDIEVPVVEDWQDDPEKVEESELLSPQDEKLPPELLESCLLRWTHPLQNGEPEKLPKGIEAVTARKIYRHRQQQIVDAFDRLFTDVVDKALFELAKEVFIKARPDAAKSWDLLSARMSSFGGDALKGLLLDGEGPKVIESERVNEEEEERKKAEAQAMTKAAAKAPLMPESQSIVPMAPMAKALPVGPLPPQAPQMQAPQRPLPPTMPAMANPMMAQLPGMLGFGAMPAMPMVPALPGAMLGGAMMAQAAEEEKAKEVKEAKEAKEAKEKEAKEAEEARKREEEVKAKEEAKKEELPKKEIERKAPVEPPPTEFEEIVNSLPVTPFWKIPAQKTEIPLGIRLRVFDSGGAREVASMAVTKSLIFGMEAERSHVVERHGQGVYAEHVALIYTAKGFHLHPIPARAFNLL